MRLEYAYLSAIRDSPPIDQRIKIFLAHTLRPPNIFNCV
jgi:hypothetical protein